MGIVACSPWPGRKPFELAHGFLGDVGYSRNKSRLGCRNALRIFLFPPDAPVTPLNGIQSGGGGGRQSISRFSPVSYRNDWLLR